MTTEGAPPTEAKITHASPVAAPPASPPAALAAPEPAKPAPQAAAPERAAALPPTRKLIRDDDDEIPADAELLEMSPKALKSRLDRYNKRSLKERFGIDDPEEIKARLDKLAQFETEREEQRKAQLTELDRAREETAAYKRRFEESETKAARAQEARVVEREDTRITGIAAKYIDSDYIEETLPRLARYLRDDCSEEDLKRGASNLIDTWFKELIERKPKLGKDYGAAVPAAPPPTVTLTSGANADRSGPTLPSGSALSKTAAPGKANSMTETELREFKRQQGLHW